MAKKTKEPVRRGPSRGVLLSVTTLVVLLAAGIYFATRSSTSRGEEAAQSASSALDQKVILPAIPRRPRPATLDPAGYQDPQIKLSYEIARHNPELLERMPCYCGCYANPGHTNNLDCFVDSHGET